MVGRKDGEAQKSMETIDQIDHLFKWYSVLLVVTILLTSLLVRCAVGFHPYSGQNQPPMYGEFEGHRHQMEITKSTPIVQWCVGRVRVMLEVLT